MIYAAISFVDVCIILHLFVVFRQSLFLFFQLPMNYFTVLVYQKCMY